MARASSDFRKPLARSGTEAVAESDVHTDKRLRSSSSLDTPKAGLEDSLDQQRVSADVTSLGEEPEDDDDRFNGSGLTAHEAEALDYLGHNEKEEFEPTEALDATAVRRLAAKLEKSIAKNQTMRARNPDDPTKFLDSEVELNERIKSLAEISEYSRLFETLVQSGGLATLVGVLAHENSDLACSAIQVLDELTDDNTASLESEYMALCQGLEECMGFESLVQNLLRLDESSPNERDAVFKSMSIMESTVSMYSNVGVILTDKTRLLAWLLKRITQPDEIGFPMSENKQYAAELLSLLCDSVPHSVSMLIDMDAIDSVLLSIAPYRKRDPDKNSIEEEFLAALFLVLDMLVTQPSGKDKFIEGEGVELLQRLYMDARSSETRQKSLRTLEYACDSWSGGAVCAKTVEVGFLKPLFSTFMKKDQVTLQKSCLGIFVSFFRTLNDGEAERVRVIHKFIEKDCAKVSRLLQFRRTFQKQEDQYLHRIQQELEQQTVKDAILSIGLERTDYYYRMENGLDTIQKIDIILAWLLVSDTLFAHHLKGLPDSETLFRRMREVLTELLTTLRQQQTSVSDEPEDIKHETQQECEMLEAILDGIPDTQGS